jgi:hypothetical protein
MKNLSMIILAVMLLTVVAVVAQENLAPANTNTTFRPGYRRMVQQKNLTTRTSSSTATDVSQTEKPANCDGSGRGYGDGTKPRPQDGTGFGAKSGNRQHRNCQLGKRMKRGPQDDSGRKLRLRKRDGSCRNNSSAVSEQSSSAAEVQTDQSDK